MSRESAFRWRHREPKRPSSWLVDAVEADEIRFLISQKGPAPEEGMLPFRTVATKYLDS